MPRVVPDQRHKFENDELFRKIGRESEVKYTGFRDRSHEERQVRFQSGCREGHSEIAFVGTGTNLHHQFFPISWIGDTKPDKQPPREYVDFDKEIGKVHLKSRFILNGVCILWHGVVDLQRLEGVGCAEFDEDRAKIEDSVLRESIELQNRRLRDFEERQRLHREELERQAEAEVESPVGIGKFYSAVSPRTMSSHYDPCTSPMPMEGVGGGSYYRGKVTIVQIGNRC